MKLEQCTLGKLVITNEKEVGHIIGLTYNVSLELAAKMSNEEKFYRTIPIVKFPFGEKAIHHCNLKEF